MDPKTARESGYYGEPLPPDQFKALVEARIRAFTDRGEITVVVSTVPNSTAIARVVTCTRPPCWPVEARKS
jgi:hypothetical protein